MLYPGIRLQAVVGGWRQIDGLRETREQQPQDLSAALVEQWVLLRRLREPNARRPHVFARIDVLDAVRLFGADAAQWLDGEIGTEEQI